MTLEAPATTTSRGPSGEAASASPSSTSASSTLPGTGRRTRAARVPRQQRGVVLGLEDERRRVARQAAAEQVEGVGGVAGEDDQVVGAGADEGADLGAGLLVPARGDLGGVAVAAVDRGVGAQGDVDGRLDRLERRGARGVVEVGVVHDRAVQRGHPEVLRHRARGSAERSGDVRGDGPQVVPRGGRRDRGAQRLAGEGGEGHLGRAPSVRQDQRRTAVP